MYIVKEKKSYMLMSHVRYLTCKRVVLAFHIATESVDNIRSNNRFQKLVATTSHRTGHQIQNLLSSLFGFGSFTTFLFYIKSVSVKNANSEPKQGGQRVRNTVCRPV